LDYHFGNQLEIGAVYYYNKCPLDYQNGSWARSQACDYQTG